MLTLTCWCTPRTPGLPVHFPNPAPKRKSLADVLAVITNYHTLSGLKQHNYPAPFLLARGPKSVSTVGRDSLPPEALWQNPFPFRFQFLEVHSLNHGLFLHPQREQSIPSNLPLLISSTCSSIINPPLPSSYENTWAFAVYTCIIQGSLPPQNP